MTSPGIMTFALRPATPDDFEFAFEAKRDALGPYTAERWGWDDALQTQHHRKQWVEKPWQIILCAGIPVGTVSIHWKPTHLQFGEFYITSSHRRQGLGTAVLSDSLKQADHRRFETRLEYLKWNPVASLYTRHDFRIVSESESHYFLVRSPKMMARKLSFDVFGTIMVVEAAVSGRRLFVLGTDGKRSPVPLPIPDFVSEREILQYLDDMFHERATPERPSVVQIMT